MLRFVTATTCPDPGTPIGGARFCTTPTHAYGSVCSFDCSRGTKLIGHDRLICKSSGGRTFWSGATPVCEGMSPCNWTVHKATSLWTRNNWYRDCWHGYFMCLIDVGRDRFYSTASTGRRTPYASPIDLPLRIPEDPLPSSAKRGGRP